MHLIGERNSNFTFHLCYVNSFTIYGINSQNQYSNVFSISLPPKWKPPSRPYSVWPIHQKFSLNQGCFGAYWTYEYWVSWVGGFGFRTSTEVILILVLVRNLEYSVSQSFVLELFHHSNLWLFQAGQERVRYWVIKYFLQMQREHLRTQTLSLFLSSSFKI